MDSEKGVDVHGVELKEDETRMKKKPELECRKTEERTKEILEEEKIMDEKCRKEILLNCAPPDPLDISGATIIRANDGAQMKKKAMKKKRRKTMEEESEEILEEGRIMNEKYSKEILLYCAPPVPLDISGATIITVNHEQLKQMNVFVPSVHCFQEQCLNRNTLQIYDHPGDPREGGFAHIENLDMEKFSTLRGMFEFAIKSCRDLCKKDLRLVSVDKWSVTISYHHVNYLTFTAEDEHSNEHTTFQAAILEIGVEPHYLLGLLRDASHDRVVAVIQIEQGCVEQNMLC